MTEINSPNAPNLSELDDSSFRRVVREWIEANCPGHLRYPPKRLHWRDTKEWYMKLAAQRWLAPGWPREHGGMGLSGSRQIIMIEEYERFGVPRSNDFGIQMLGPLLIQFGTPEQQRFFLPEILSGEHIWCQGYSEPNAGSDLASLRTEAVPEGDSWIVNGQKTWATLANDANWIFLLVRTDRTVKKQEGISFLLVQMNSPGVTVRPIRNLDLDDEFCEVFFDGVRVPRENLVGEVNKGWTMAKALLGFERIMIGSPKQSSYALSRLHALIERLGLRDDAAVRAQFARLHLDLADHKALYQTFVDKVARGEQIGADVSLLKVHQSELYQRITNMMLDVAGEYGALLEHLDGETRLHPAGTFIQSRAPTIYGGTSEVQRNVLAKTVLNLG